MSQVFQVSGFFFPARSQRRGARRAFNLLEMLVVMLLIGIFSAVTYTSLDRTLPRYKLRGRATEVSGFLQKARLGAIKAGLDVSVEVESVSNSDPEQALIAYRNNTNGTKTELGRVMIGASIRPFEPYLGGVPGESGSLAVANTFPAAKVIFKSTGNAQNTGALRFTIGTGDHTNTIEVAVLSLGGQPVIRKYIKSADRPASATSEAFFEETHYGTTWTWAWY